MIAEYWRRFTIWIQAALRGGVLDRELYVAPRAGALGTAWAAPFDPTERLLNGRRAEALLSDPLLNAVFEAVANQYRKAWENAPRGDVERQRCAHYSLAALKDVQAGIRAHLLSSKLFEADLEAQRRREAAKTIYQ